MDLFAQLRRQLCPACPVILSQPIFDAADGVLVAPALPGLDHLVGGDLLVWGALEEGVGPGFFVVHFGGRRVEGDEDVFAELVAGGLHALGHDFERLVVALERGGEAAFVADGGVVALLLEDAFERDEALGAHLEGLGEALGAPGLDHELLEVDVVVGVLAAVENVHHGDGEDVGAGPAEIAEEGQSGVGGRGLCGSERDGEHGVGAQASLVGGAIELDHDLVDLLLIRGIEADDGIGDLAVDVFDGLENALAAVTAFVAIAEFDGLELPGGGATGHGGLAHRAIFEHDDAVDGRRSTGVQDFTGFDMHDGAGHGASPASMKH